MMFEEPGAPAELRIAKAGDAQHNEMIAFAEIIRSAVAPYCDADPNKMAIAMTAAVMFAGTMFGSLITIGVARDGDKKRVTDSMARNFRAGIDVGKRRVFRAAAEHFGEGNA